MRFSKPVFVLLLTVFFTSCLLQTDLFAGYISDQDADEGYILVNAGWGGAIAGTWYDDEGMYDSSGNWIEGKFAGASPYAYFWNNWGAPVKAYYSDEAKLSNNKGTKYPTKSKASEGWVPHDDWFVDSSSYVWDVTNEPWGNYDVRNECRLELKAHRNPDGVVITLETFQAISELSFEIPFE